MDTCKVMLHEWKHYNKSNLSKWTGAIKTTILNYPKEVTVQELAKALTDGQTVILGHLEYNQKDLEIMKKQEKKLGASSRHWKNQQIFAVDIDNDKYKQGDPKYITIDKAIRMCKDKKCPPAFIYTTYSHKEEHHKFRVVFVSTEEITTFDKRTKLLESIFEVFAINGECLVDSKCSDPARLFYPGKELVYTDYDAKIDPDDLIERIKPKYKLEKVALTTSTGKKRTYIKSSNKVINLLRQDKTKEAIYEIAKSLQEAGKPYSDWVEMPSTKGGTVTILYIIKDYCTANAQDPLEPVFIRDPEDYYELAQRFPLDKLLGVELNEHFSCVLPEHQDIVGSARIERRHDDDTYIYHCYGCMGVNKYYDIFTFLEHACGWTHAKAKEFINEMLNVEFETAWQKERKEDISNYLDYIGSPQFEKRFPLLKSELVSANALGVFEQLLLEARRTIQDHLVTQTEDPVFFLGIRKLQKKLSERGIERGISNTSLQRKLKWITKLKLLTAVDDSSLPIEFVKHAHDKRFQKKYRYRLNFYMVPKFSTKLFADAEDIIRETKDLNIRRRYYSRQTELWASGEKEANRQYVQDKDVGKSRKTITFYERYREVAKELLEKGYTTEKEILNHHRIRGVKRKKELSATVMPQLLQEFDLRIVRYSKYYKELFQIKQDTSLKYGASKIIVRSSDEQKK